MVKQVKAVEGKELLVINLQPRTEVVVKPGEAVKKGQVLGSIKQERVVYDLAGGLKTKAGKINSWLKRKTGEEVQPGDVLVQKSSWFRAQRVVSQVAGTILEVKEGRMTIELKGEEVEVKSPVSGMVVEVTGEEIKVEIEGETLEGSWGWGPKLWGELMVVGENNGEVTIESLRGDFKDKVVVLGSELQKGLWHKLCALGIKSLLCAQVPNEFSDWLAEDEDDEELKQSVVVLGRDGEMVDDSGEGDDQNDEDSGFTTELWSWFNKRVGRVAVVDGKTKKLFVSKE